ncbi:MAG: 3-oxoacyl-ACP reductase [Acidiphilium sp. 37-67-22]|jgi:NAD(P)-dependent dehydrogenase (short-subunit alcohol dehydrogenase family)|uniref:SDR family oxidoreductase n=1 Tax=unclassified Acidiphilium TaxID=2617493 RepID=UPI000BD12D7E|nr:MULTISPECIES: SDR family oxidoreductase [unclassified Acidiphilium]OYV56854.1 MAG: 3-oxoacyl-ACP reductase [Acidiphilium sp. 20-67-58]OYW08323.1 MAG: 3-oxoacyl-ACP reductase [Acidiphilium sp. 37-67-22]HQT60458.1 SDR family oxidoreductase [Acidiphilium sp.]HQU11574.1 SDR family oxidoreductase [Acidiphilium sp.]
MIDPASLFSLQGRVALVTGGSRGIGRMIAEGFLAQGARVYISARKAEQCHAAAAELGPDCIAVPADISTVEGARALAATITAREPALDILVNNAGAAWGAPFESFPEHGWDKVFDVNVKAPFFLTQALHGALKAAARPDRPAKVICVGSIDGLRVNAWETYSYQASKAAIHHLMRRMAARLIHDNIVASAIAPGAFPSEMNRAARDRGEAVAAAIPARRIGRAEDMAGAAIYLASRAGDYVVGQVLTVDGGLVAANPVETAEP